MAKVTRVAATIFCLLSVLAICIAPCVDLPDTSLRSNNQFVLLLCCLMAGAFLLVRRVRKSTNPAGGIPLTQIERKKCSVIHPLYTTCVLQC